MGEPFICIWCGKTEVTVGLVCDPCTKKDRLRKSRLVEVSCDDCGNVEEVYYRRAPKWVCRCKVPRVRRTGRQRAQEFNRAAKRDHPSKWAEGVATPAQQERIVRFLNQNPDLLAQLIEDSSRLRARCSNYAATVAWWMITVAEQNGGCAICGSRPESVIDLHIDHDHDSGSVRGLLCNGCNTGLGHLGVDGPQDLDRVRSAVRYIEAFRTSQSLRTSTG